MTETDEMQAVGAAEPAERSEFERWQLAGLAHLQQRADFHNIRAMVPEAIYAEGYAVGASEQAGKDCPSAAESWNAGYVAGWEARDELDREPPIGTVITVWWTAHPSVPVALIRGEKGWRFGDVIYSWREIRSRAARWQRMVPTGSDGTPPKPRVEQEQAGRERIAAAQASMTNAFNSITRAVATGAQVVMSEGLSHVTDPKAAPKQRMREGELTNINECRHCSREIYRVGQQWLHRNDGLAGCTSGTSAQPREESQCGYCGREIYRSGQIWFHRHNSSDLCSLAAGASDAKAFPLETNRS